MQIPGVLSVSFSNTGSASTDVWNSPYEYSPSDKDLPPIKGKTQVKASDESFLEVYGLSLLYGENLRVSEHEQQVLINETFLKELGVSIPTQVLGASLTIWGKPYRIVGEFTVQYMGEKVSVVDGCHVGSMKISQGTDVHSIIRRLGKDIRTSITET